MEQLVVTTAVTACVSGIIGAIVAALVAALRTSGSKAVDTSKAMQDGMRALLWRELKDIHAAAIDNNGMSVEDRRHLESVYSPYHGLGGNGTGTRLYEEAMNTPLID